MSKQSENANYTRQHEMLFAPDLYSTTAPFDDYSTHASSAQYNPTPEYSSFLLFYNIFHSRRPTNSAHIIPEYIWLRPYEISHNIFLSRPNLKLAYFLLCIEREREIWSHREIEEKGKTRWIDSHMIYNLLEFVRRKSNE